MKSDKLHATPRGLAAITTLALIFGITAILARFLGKNTGLFEQWYLRYGIMLMLSVIVFHGKIEYRKFLILPAREWGVIVFRALIGSVVAVALYTLAAQKAKIGIVSFMQVIPSTSILGIFLFHEKISKARAGTILLAFFGAVLVVVDRLSDLGSINVGAMLSLVSGILFGLQFVTRQWHSKRLNNQELTVIIIALGFVMNYILSLVLYHRVFVPSSDWSLQFALVLLAAGFCGVANSFLINYGFEHVSAVIAGNILSLEEVFGSLFGYFIYGETLTIRDIAGGAIILVAVILTNGLNNREKIQNGTPPN